MICKNCGGEMRALLTSVECPACDGVWNEPTKPDSAIPTCAYASVLMGKLVCLGPPPWPPSPQPVGTCPHDVLYQSLAAQRDGRIETYCWDCGEKIP